jgi:hypothetical protein
MNVEYTQISSVESSDHPKPWYVVEVDGGEVAVTEDKDGGRQAGLQNARTNTPDHVDLPDESAVSGSGKVTYAVTVDGEFISYDPENADPPNLRAHLGWYDSDTDTLTLLDFVEPNNQS